MLSTIRRTDPISKIKESSRLSENFPSRLTFGKRFHYFPSVPYSLPIRQTYSTCRTANSFLRLLSDHRLYTTCSSTADRLTARIWQRLNLLVGSRIDPYLFHRNNYTPRSIPFTIFSWSTTIPTYLIQKDDSYTAYIARDDFYNTSPPTRSLFELSIPRRLHIDSVQSKTTHAKENYYIYHRPFPTVCKPRLFSLSYVLSSARRGKNKSAFLGCWKNSIRRGWSGETIDRDSVQRRRRVRTAQSEPEEFRRLDISSDDHPARSGRPINRQDLADRPWEKFASPHASSRSIDFIVGARRCIWCGKISRYSPHLLFPFLYLLSIDGSNFNRFSFSRNHLYYRHFGTVYRWMYENFYFAIKIRDPLIVTREQIYVLDWFCFVEQWDERDWRIIKPSADKRYSWEKQWGDILFRSIANRFWTDIKIYGSSLFHSDFAPSSHQLETSFYFPGCIKKIVCETVVY